MKLNRFISTMIPLLALLSLSLPAAVHARDVIYGKAKETITISFGVQTLFRFPMEVKTVTDAPRFEIKPAATEEPDYSVLAVKPRMSEGVSDVSFILSDGSVIRTQLIVAKSSRIKKDSIYDFRPKDELANSNPNLMDQREPLSISEMDLMRSMVDGSTLSGFEVKFLSQPIQMPEPKLKVTLIKSYSGSSLQGLVYLLECHESKTSIPIEIEKLGIGRPNLALLAQSDLNELQCRSRDKKQTLLRVVTQLGATRQKLSLPTAIDIEKGNS